MEAGMTQSLVGMDGGASGGNGAGSPAPAPFLLKTYEMVDDSTSDAIVSWSGSRKSFIVWDPPEFSRVLLPSFFKHSNFSSFIRQLNTYGFRKIDPERWEFANDDFVKDQKHLLKNIYRRKPIHSHSQPQVALDSSRAAYEEEIDKLSREKAALEGKLLRYGEQHSAKKAQMENLTQRITAMEQTQEKLLRFLEKAAQNPEFVEKLVLKLESMDFSAYNKKRRIPQAAQENAVIDNHSRCMPEPESISQQDLSNTLRLELLPAVSEVNVVSGGMMSSNEDEASPQCRRETIMSKDLNARTAGFFCASEIVELSDTGASFNLNADSPLSGKVGSDSPKLHSLQAAASNDEGDDPLSCLLNLTLASSSVELSRSQHPAEGTQSSQDVPTVAPRLDSCDRTPDNNARILFSPGAAPTADPSPAPQVNDLFWEQFLTERPGCSDNEETTTCHLMNYNSRMKHLTL